MSPSQHIADVTKADSCWARTAGLCRGWTAKSCWTGLQCVVGTGLLTFGVEELIR